MVPVETVQEATSVLFRRMLIFQGGRLQDARRRRVLDWNDDWSGRFDR